jgi:hypothetical protein
MIDFTTAHPSVIYRGKLNPGHPLTLYRVYLKSMDETEVWSLHIK